MADIDYEVAHGVALTELAKDRQKINRLRQLVQTLMDNDPMEYIADGGVTVLDQWRKDAARILKE